MAERRVIATGRKNGDHFEITPVWYSLPPRAKLEAELTQRLGSAEAVLYVMTLIDVYVAAERGLAQGELLLKLLEDMRVERTA